ncbi:MAG: AraC family transcriptional regulator [Sphingomonadales bacterium]|nr:MAG: AraC family transcriptional regulator [Sphingomonadales bacterium]
MDLLSDILDTIALRGQIYFRTCFTGPWSVAVPQYQRAIRFHYVVQGVCHVTMSAGQELALRQGDIALIPSGAAHILSDQPGRIAASLETVLNDAGFTGEGALCLGAGDDNHATQMICGHFVFAEGSDHPLLRAMPQHFHITAGMRTRNLWLDEALRLMARQMMSDNPGGSAAVRRMSEVIFIEAIRCCAEQSKELERFMHALSDAKISRALAAIHQMPAQAWTVEKMAAAAAMSRSRFADRFQELTGMAPLAYLTEWRMQRARRMLSSTSANIQEIAGAVGYQSAAAFTRAFATMYGEPPTDFRRRAAA